MKLYKNLALAFTEILILGIMVGCTITPTSTSTTKATIPTTKATTTPTTAATTTTEPVTLKLGSNSDGFPETPISWLEFDNIKKMMSDLNIKIEYAYYDNDKFSLLLASSDLPDVVVGSQPYLSEILSNKLALNLDPLLAEYAPNMMLDMYKTRNDMLRNLMGGTDKALYFLPANYGREQVGGGQQSAWGYNIRWDYYKEIGCPAVNNDQDYLNVMKTILEKHPTTENGDKIYGEGLYDDFGWVWFTRAAFTKACGLNPWTFANYQYMADWLTDELVDGYINTDRSAYWIDMAFYNKANRMGMIDPDCFTMTWDEFEAKMNKGQYLAVHCYAYGSLYSEMAKTNTNTLTGYMIIPSDNNVCGGNLNHPTGNAPTLFTFVSAKSDNWKTALAFFNYISDPDNIRMLYSGVKGIAWDYDKNNVPYILDKTLADKTANNDAWQRSGVMLNLQTPLIPMSGAELHPDGYSYFLLADANYRNLGLTPLQQDYCTFYKVKYPAQAVFDRISITGAIDESHSYAQTIMSGVSEIPNDIQRILNQCNDILYRAVPKLVLAKDDAEFSAIQAQIVADVQAAGEATAWAWCSEQYNASKAKVDQLIKR
jgi:putative aldouronate transport system substrate-binding protein